MRLKRKPSLSIESKIGAIATYRIYTAVRKGNYIIRNTKLNIHSSRGLRGDNRMAYQWQSVFSWL